MHLLRIWQSVCRSPQSLYAAESVSFLLHCAKLALCGRVSQAALRANFIWAGGKDCVDFAHTVAAVGSTMVKGYPELPEKGCVSCTHFVAPSQLLSSGLFLKQPCQRLQQRLVAPPCVDGISHVVGSFPSSGFV